MSYLGNSPTDQSFVATVDYFNGDGVTVAFTLSRQVASVAQVQAVIENVPQNPSSAFTLMGNVITFTSAPPSGSANIYVYYTSPNTQVIAPSAGTVDRTALAAAAVTPVKMANYGAELGMRNRIINGAMMIDQRNNGASVTGNNAVFPIDRFVNSATQTAKLTIQQNQGSITPPTGFSNYVGYTSSSSYSLISSDFFVLRQEIEGYNTADLAWGTPSASPITLSFWVRSSLTGSFGVTFRNSGGTRSYAALYTINAANAWEYKTITIAGDTSGTWLTNNSSGIGICFGLGVGSTYSGTAGSWASANYIGTTGATSVVGTNGATFQITGVQLEKGTLATPFEYRPYGTELNLCYRYYRRYASAGAMIGTGSWFNNTTVYRWGFQLDVPMRTTPTVNLGTCAGWGGNAVGGMATVSTSYCSPTLIDCDLSLASSMGAATGQTVVKVYMTGASPYVELNGAEL